jgi:peptidoglycan/LPS O-acetylase OafA/YrhL
MLGALRFALAMAVAFSHTGLTPNFHFGAMAVVVFFLIAGYVMTHSFEANFGNSLTNIRAFYLDRFFRIYPLYLLSLVLIVGFVAVSGYGTLYLDARSVLVNLTVFPLNHHRNIINPVTWSLGTELQFYVLLPFLVRFRTFKYLLLPFSYAIFVVASFQVLPPEQWAYKFLPGTLFMFIVGSIIYDMRTDKTSLSKNILIGTAVASGLHLVVLSFSPKNIDQPYAFESLVGFAVGILCLVLLGEVRPAHKRLDNWLGQMSYPLFLSHVVVLYLFDYLRLQHGLSLSLRGAVALQMIGALLLSVPLKMFDSQFQVLRKRIQVRNVRSREAVHDRPSRSIPEPIPEPAV